VVTALDWQAGAACGGADPRLFDNTTRDPDAARAYCQRCPVTEQCLADALATGAIGVRGGRLLGAPGRPTTTEHGTRSCYINHGCRRPECTEAARVYDEQRRRTRGAKPRATLQHGTRSCYAKGCRRAECRAADNTYQRAKRAARKAREEAAA